jgi:hypothetical protein
MDADRSEWPFRRDGHEFGSGPREPAAQGATVISTEDHICGSGRQHPFARVRHDVAITAPETTYKRRQCPAGPVHPKGRSDFAHHASVRPREDRGSTFYKTPMRRAAYCRLGGNDTWG